MGNDLFKIDGVTYVSSKDEDGDGGRWRVDKTAIYQPSTHYPTTRYTPAGRYGRFFA